MIDLKGKTIFVVTNTEMGWDCVCGVYLANSKQEVIDYLGEEYNSENMVHAQRLTVIKTKTEIRDEKIDNVLGLKEITTYGKTSN